MVPLVGPSSITLALMASGLEGQRFAFCGYLPRETAERASSASGSSRTARAREHETEIFIETPYRNDVLLAALLEDCRDTTKLCVAADLTLPTERSSRRNPSRNGAAQAAPIGRRPAVFLLLADAER